MDEFDFTDGLKIVLVSIFMLGSVQLHALIDESSDRAADRSEGKAPSAQAGAVVRRVGTVSDGFDDADDRLRSGPAFRT